MVRFLVAKGARTCEIHHRMFAVYGKHCMSLTSVHEWQKRFCKELTSLQDDLCPRQAHQPITLDVIAQIDGLIRENQRITEEQIRVQVGISHGSVHAIIKDHLQWVPHQLTEGQTIDRMAACPSYCSDSMRKSMCFCHISSQGTKHGATILSPRANGKANNGKTSILPHQRNPYKYQ